ncbi:MAG TPA: HD domain-containing protein [Acholeplasmataceae bacterium]|nr:HD domain-containing protein [Acholeplasmataceae bacterium]
MKTSAEFDVILWNKYLSSGSKDIKLRYEHSLAVKKKALELIDTFNFKLDKEKTAIAAVLHDYAKYETKERYREIVKRYELDIALLDENPKVHHSLLGPFVIKEELGLEDEEILAAIATHTLGSLKMSLLGEVIFLADFTEDGRIGPEFEAAKRLSRIDFYGAILEKIKSKLRIYPDELSLKLYQKYQEVKWKS